MDGCAIFPHSTTADAQSSKLNHHTGQTQHIRRPAACSLVQSQYEQLARLIITHKPTFISIPGAGVI